MASSLALFGGAPVVAPGAHRRWPQVSDEDRRAVAGVLDRAIFSGMYAPESAALEREFASFVGAASAQLTPSGTSALQVALAAASIGEGHEVIVPAYSFVATPLSVLHQGAIPIFVDVDPDHGNLDTGAIEAAITARTRAIMPVHVHGCPCDLDEVLAIARRRDLLVIEDAAQAHGATYKGRPVGAIGAAGGFSLQSSKNLPGGEGGIFVTNDPELAAAARRVRSFGQDIVASDAAHFTADRPLDGHRAIASGRIGWMLRGNEMMAALVRSQLARLPEVTRRCQENAEALRLGLSGLPGVMVPCVPADRTSVHHKVRVHFDPDAAGMDCSPRALRDTMLQALSAEGLEVVLWQNEPLPAQPLFQGNGFGRGFPWSSGDMDAARANYDPRLYPMTTRLLERSIVVFSQSCPLIAQEAPMVARYVEAFHKVWEQRFELIRRLAPGAEPSP
jgi:dTDP-4-amino-4,6-dideoxygalactose transaminase